MKQDNETYLPGWAILKLAVAPNGELNALGGDRGPGDPNSDRSYIGLERINEFYVRKDCKYQSTKNSPRLESVEARYKDLLNHLGVQGHDGAVFEIETLRNYRFNQVPSATNKGQFVFTLDLSKINDIQKQTITEMMPEVKKARWTDINTRKDGHTQSWQADWMRYLTLHPLSTKAAETKTINSKFTRIHLDSNNRMLRVGFGKSDGKRFIRLDLWSIGFRFTF